MMLVLLYNFIDVQRERLYWHLLLMLGLERGVKHPGRCCKSG